VEYGVAECMIGDMSLVSRVGSGEVEYMIKGV
jgi:hypothetical protein